MLAVFAIGISVGGSGVIDDTAEVRSASEEHTLPSTLEAGSEWTRMLTNETVTHDTQTLERGEDYAIDEETGDIWALNSSYSGEQVTVEYHYQWHDQDTRGILAALAPLQGVLKFLLLIAALGAVIGWMGWL